MTVALAAYTPHKWHDIGGRLICWWSRRPESTARGMSPGQLVEYVLTRNGELK